MGQKANPIALRLGIIRDWDSTWFAGKEYRDFVLEDVKVREFLKKELKKGGIASIKIKRKSGIVEADVYAAKPGVIIGKGGSDIANLQGALAKLVDKKARINIIEEKYPEINAQLISDLVAAQLIKRMPFRRVMKFNVQKAMKAGAKGVFIKCAGRLGGAEIARTENYREGKIPRNTFRADIDYAFTEAFTTFGIIGVTVLVYRGEIIGKKSKKLMDLSR